MTDKIARGTLRADLIRTYEDLCRKDLLPRVDNHSPASDCKLGRDIKEFVGLDIDRHPTARRIEGVFLDREGILRKSPLKIIALYGFCKRDQQPFFYPEYIGEPEIARDVRFGEIVSPGVDLARVDFINSPIVPCIYHLESSEGVIKLRRFNHGEHLAGYSLLDQEVFTSVAYKYTPKEMMKLSAQRERLLTGENLDVKSAKIWENLSVS